MQSNVMKVNQAINAEVITHVVGTVDSIESMATVQIIVPTEREVSLMMLTKFDDLQKRISVYANNIDYLNTKLSMIEDQGAEIVKLTEVLYDTNERLKAKDTVLKNLPQWHSVSAVAKAKGLSDDAVRKQLENGEFEDGVDFKKPNGRIQINQGAVERIQRKRRNSDA